MEKGLALISGGIDSPVAASLVQRKGYDLVAVHFAHEAFTSAEPTEKTKRLAKKLGLKLYIVDVNEAFAALANARNLYYVMQKRLMLRVAERLAKRENCSFLVTGENLGQVSSQTLHNLSIIDKAVTLPVLRPLLSNEKNDIVKIARDIGTYEISCGPEHCDALGPERPRTKANMEEVLAEEARLNAEVLVERAFATVKAARL